MQSLIIIQSYYHIPTVGQVEEMTEDLVQDIKFLKEYLPFFNEQERESFKEEIRDLYEKKKLQGNRGFLIGIPRCTNHFYLHFGHRAHPSCSESRRSSASSGSSRRILWFFAVRTIRPSARRFAARLCISPRFFT